MRVLPRRPIIYLLTTALAVATAFALFGTAMTLGAARVADPRLVATETVVRAFYFAVNETIRTGDAAALDGVVAEDLVAYGGTEALAPGRAGLVEYLRSLHATSPDVEIQVGQVAAAGDRAIAYLDVRGEETTSAGLPRPDHRDAWGRIDGLRVSGHRVLEIWSGADGLSLVEPWRLITHDLPLGERQMVVLDRLTLPLDGRLELPGVADNRLVYVDDGFVTSEVAPVASSVTNTSGVGAPVGYPYPTPAPTVSELERGDFVSIAAGAVTTLRNSGNGPATILITTIVTPGEAGRLGAGTASPRHELRPDPDGVPQQIGQDRTFADGSVLQPLAGGVISTIPTDATAAAIGRITLLPGATLPGFETRGPFLLTVEAGALDVQATGGKVWVNRGVRGWSNSFDAGTLAAGDGAFLHTETVIALSNDGTEPAVVLIVSLLPDDAPVT